MDCPEADKKPAFAVRTRQGSVIALRDALSEDYDMARKHLSELDEQELKELFRACMALQNLTRARLYALAQQGCRDVDGNDDTEIQAAG